MSFQFDELPTSSAAGERALALYKKGMKDLGRSLLLLCALQVLGAILIVLSVFDPVALAIVGILAAIELGLGICVLQMQSWANYAVAVVGGLILAANLYAMGARNQGGITSVTTCLGIVIGAGLIYLSINNLKALRRARSLGMRV
jgi:hypothetical protein